MFYEELEIWEDKIFWLLYMKNIKNVFFIDRALYHYVQAKKERLSGKYVPEIFQNVVRIFNIMKENFENLYDMDTYYANEYYLNILALQYPDSGKLSTDVPDVDTGIDWLVYLARYSQQCQAQSHFVVRSRLDIVENTEIMVGPNQSFYCGTLRPDCRPFRTGIFTACS